MNSIDLTPLYRSSIGYDRLASLLNSALNTDSSAAAYPPYNIEVLDESRYAITLAVAGFEQAELSIKIEKGVLSVSGDRAKTEERRYLHQGIANRAFERKFNLAEHVEVIGAQLNNGLLTINLVKEIPEAMKPKTIAIDQAPNALEHKADHQADATDSSAA
ncbi:Hsp20 family protein [Marinobacterium jannaschii]|uniref:Hsp20 family protein n=1 Tax=Marinobacterium jannaschii TaxID=64970 RepID=UPI0004872681|nr:Hsp20 family protein [Marinobacterium jannaschii]